MPGPPLVSFGQHMSSPTEDRRDVTEPGPDTRAHFRRLWDVVFVVLRFIARHAHNVYAAFGIFLLIGAAIAIGGTWGFAELAGHVSGGGTQAFDDAVLQWLGQHRTKPLDAFMLDVTALGTSSVVAMVVGVAALFLWLNKHKHSAILLLVSTFGGVLLNNLLKFGFSRPRPDIIPWATTATFYSFPSGHAMSATVVYSTVAYLAGRLQRTHRARLAVAVVATLVVFIICLSRLYLGVHYPSDVIAGIIIGLAWAAFCMATLEAIQLYARRNAPQMLEEEHPAPVAES